MTEISEAKVINNVISTQALLITVFSSITTQPPTTIKCNYHNGRIKCDLYIFCSQSLQRP